MNLIDFNYKKEISSPVKAVCCSNFQIDNKRLAVILNSRQTKTPCGNDPWIISSLKAVRYAIDNDYILVASLGMNTWELICWAGGSFYGYQLIVLPVASTENVELIIKKTLDDFNLDFNRTGWIFYDTASKTKASKADWPVRDRLAINSADVIMPVSIRPGGNLLSMLNQHISSDEKNVIENFRGQYGRRKRNQVTMPEQTNEKLSNMDWNYITHWTRTCYGPWPGETRHKFYHKMIHSKEHYPNAALETLKNILLEKKIRGSSIHLRQGNRAVAFSSLHPKDVLSLMRWRKRYVRWNFEPYGIAFTREIAIRAGIQPVLYGEPDHYNRLNERDKPYFQSQGIDGGNWREEREWRYIGDLDLTEIKPDDIKIIVRKPDETESLAGITDSEIISFT